MSPIATGIDGPVTVSSPRLKRLARDEGDEIADGAAAAGDGEMPSNSSATRTKRVTTSAVKISAIAAAAAIAI